MKFRPCIDLHHGQVKQIVGGTLADDGGGLVENFVSDRGAAYYAALFKADGLTGGHVIMLGPGNEAEARQALSAYPGGLQIGGGITAANAGSYLDQGASHVIVTSYVFQDEVIRFDKLREMVAAVGRERLVLDLSCRAKDGIYYVVTNRWQQFTSYEVNQTNLAELARYCAEFLVHGVDVEGQCRGVAEDLVVKLGQWVTIPTTYAGGARSLADLVLVNRLGGGRLDLTIGSSLDIFGGQLPYRQVVNWRPQAIEK